MTTATPNLAQDLIRIHKVITRSLEVSLGKGREYLKSGFSNPQEQAGYSSYIHCFTAVLGSHHQSEDIIAFPAFQKVLSSAPYDRLAADHQGVHTLLAFLPQAVMDLSGNATESGLSVITDTMAKISDVWYQHIQVEEEHFSEPTLNAVFTLEEQKDLNMATSKYSQEHSEPPYWVIPFVLFNLEQDERSKMTALMPPMIVDELVPKVWMEQWLPMKPFLLE